MTRGRSDQVARAQVVGANTTHVQRVRHTRGCLPEMSAGRASAETLSCWVLRPSSEVRTPDGLAESCLRRCEEREMDLGAKSRAIAVACAKCEALASVRSGSRGASVGARGRAARVAVARRERRARGKGES